MGGKIMIVDDEHLLVDALAERFGLRNVETIKAYNAKDALHEMDDDIKVAIVDLRMPDMDGIELTKAVKKLYPSVEVIILTGYKNRYVVDKALEAGASEVHDKHNGEYNSIFEKLCDILEKYGVAVAFAEKDDEDAAREIIGG
jgi:DNA-binding NarL/FixJ family response regulator